MIRFRLACLAGAFTVGAIYGQRPIVQQGSVANAASYAARPSVLQGLAPGSMASIFGRNLAVGTQSASTIPLPAEMQGTSVSIGGQTAPLYFVSPNQINIQIPREFFYKDSRYPLDFPLIVASPAGQSDPVSVSIVGAAPGIFTLDASGCGRGAIQNVADDGSTSLNSPSNSVSPGQYITAYGTGFLTFDPGNVPPTGSIPFNVSGRVDDAVWDLGPPGTPRALDVAAPGLVGVDQSNILVPLDVREGYAVPLHLNSSQDVTVSVARGGGQCIDPPASAFALFTAEKRSITSPSSTAVTETFSGSILSSPAKKRPAPAVNSLGMHPWVISGPGRPVCPIPGYQELSSGMLHLGFPNGNSVDLAPTFSPAGFQYSGSLSSGSLGPGTYTISAAGSDRVGAFSSTVRVGQDITAISVPPLGSNIPFLNFLTVTWSGGDADSVVTVTVTGYPGFLQDSISKSVPATDGTVTIGTAYVYPYGGGLGIPASLRGDITVDVEPKPASLAQVNAPGVALGGEAVWRYRHIFTGYTIK